MVIPLIRSELSLRFKHVHVSTRLHGRLHFTLVHVAGNMQQRPLVSNFMRGNRIRCNTGQWRKTGWGPLPYGTSDGGGGGEGGGGGAQ